MATHTVIRGASVQMRHTECWSCGLPFAMPEAWARKRSEEGKSFYCPKGCHLSYGQSEVEKERARRERAERRADSYRRDYEHESRRSAAYRGHLTRVKKRVGSGVCPCCKRTFKQLAAHMKRKHPDYAEPQE